MRKIFIIAAVIISAAASAQSVVMTRNGNQYELSKPTLKQQADHDATVLTIKDTDGKVYPLFITAKGRCYILRTSKKTGKEYRKYLTEEQSRQICKDNGIEYVEKTETK